MDVHILFLTLIVLLAYVTQAMTGFGSLIIVVTLGSHLYPIEFLLPVIVPLDILVNSYIVAKYAAAVDRPLLLYRIAPLVGIGLLTGIGIFQFVQGALLRRSFGVLVTLLCLRELSSLLRTSGTERTLSRMKYASSVLAAGVVQGLFASGGPLLVYAVGRLDLPKARFRSTLSALWLLTNSVLTLSYIATGRLTLTTSRLAVWLVLPIILGIVMGEKLHDHANEYLFRVVVYLILLAAGVSIVVR